VNNSVRPSTTKTKPIECMFAVGISVSGSPQTPLTSVNIAAINSGPKPEIEAPR
jgi:hypothetical protein